MGRTCTAYLEAFEPRWRHPPATLSSIAKRTDRSRSDLLSSGVMYAALNAVVMTPRPGDRLCNFNPSHSFCFCRIHSITTCFISLSSNLSTFQVNRMPSLCDETMKLGQRRRYQFCAMPHLVWRLKRDQIYRTANEISVGLYKTIRLRMAM